MVALILAPGASAAVTYKVLHQFNGTDGVDPRDFSGLIFDASGNLYGTTTRGGVYGYGAVFQLYAQRGWQLDRKRALQF